MIPQRLYGRQREIATLVDAFERVSRDGRQSLDLGSPHCGCAKPLPPPGSVGMLSAVALPSCGRPLHPPSFLGAPPKGSGRRVGTPPASGHLRSTLWLVLTLTLAEVHFGRNSSMV
jgi:hypothetical protein